MLVNYISIKTTIGRFIREYGLEDTSFVDDIPQWVEDAVQIIGIANYYINKRKVIKIEEYKGTLPCDIEYLYALMVSCDCNIVKNIKDLTRLTIRNVPLIGNAITTGTHESAYGTINGGFVHTSFDKGFVYCFYKGIPLDEEGYPLVPKDAKVNEALQYYFIMRMALSGYKHPILSFKDAMQLWNQTYPQAGNSINWMDLQDYQDFTELWTNPLMGDLHANQYIH